MKKCSKCKEYKDESEFSKGNDIHGLQYKCKACVKEYNKNNEEHINKYYKINIIHKKEYDKKYRKDNIENRNEYNKEYNKNRNKIDPLFKLICNMRSLLKESMKRGGFKKTSKTAEYLCCTYEEFKIWIENQFTDVMNWNNYGEWEYHNIYPISMAIDEEHFRQLNHYTNFQPLWREDNRKKGNKIPEHLKDINSNIDQI
jgi:hypothetical protein